ncbi:hypothetical protein JTB14_004225 [Gonioctena quinquepunctata]|nr:hypothetical protein JTB14_004225 [Gonioctena quinquepunctata]
MVPTSKHNQNESNIELKWDEHNRNQMWRKQITYVRTNHETCMDPPKNMRMPVVDKDIKTFSQKDGKRLHEFFEIEALQLLDECLSTEKITL